MPSTIRQFPDESDELPYDISGYKSVVSKMRELSFLVSLLVLLRYLICSRGFGLSSSPWESKQNVNVNPDDSSLKVESMSIHSLEDHENEAIRMAASLNLWLDREVCISYVDEACGYMFGFFN